MSKVIKEAKQCAFKARLIYNFIRLSGNAVSTWEEAIQRWPMQLGHKEIEHWIEKFGSMKSLKSKTDTPVGFQSWVMNIVNPMTKTEGDFEFMGWKSPLDPNLEILYLPILGSVENIIRKVPKLAYRLVIADPPYGLTKETWDQQVRLFKFIFFKKNSKIVIVIEISLQTKFLV